MPKPMTIKMDVPSNSRPSALLTWLNKLLEPHRMVVREVTDDEALSEATAGLPQNDDQPTVVLERFGDGRLKPFLSAKDHD